MASPFDDPRVPRQYVRHINGSDDHHSVTLVGVVHDHPASVHRVEALAGYTHLDILALELSPLLVPLFTDRADADVDDPGSELRAAIAATDSATVIGIDGPSPGLLITLLRTMHARNDTARTALATLRRFMGASRRVLSYRLQARLDRPIPTAGHAHEVTGTDPPDQQAANERRQVHTATAVSNAFDPSAVIECRDETRERHMAARLESLRADGTVLAVVGIDHLDAIAARLG